MDKAQQAESSPARDSLLSNLSENLIAPSWHRLDFIRSGSPIRQHFYPPTYTTLYPDNEPLFWWLRLDPLIYVRSSKNSAPAIREPLANSLTSLQCLPTARSHQPRSCNWHYLFISLYHPFRLWAMNPQLHYLVSIHVKAPIALLLLHYLRAHKHYLT